MKNKIKITVVGSGYVGMSLAVLLSQNNDVVILDIDTSRIDMINKGISPIQDKEIEAFLLEKNLNLSATLDANVAYDDASFIVIATPTNYDPTKNSFDTGSVDSVVKDVININPNSTIVIKSTIPLGHTKYLQDKHDTNHIIFSPEFLREGQALRDNLYPSRIIVGSKIEAGKDFADLLVKSADKKDIETLFMNSTEAEAVKLFANSYLAMRVSFFNELDSYALARNLDTQSIINGMCLDERIGAGYNNPSFGYGGYCFPKDTKQLLANYKENRIPNRLVGSVVYSNEVRKDWIANQILRRNPNVVGIYRMAMKTGSDNYRSSAIQGIIERLRTQVKVIIYEPMCKEQEFLDCVLETELNKFKKLSDVIVANRLEDNITDVKEKVYTRDIYGNN